MWIWALLALTTSFTFLCFAIYIYLKCYIAYVRTDWCSRGAESVALLCSRVELLSSYLIHIYDLRLGFGFASGFGFGFGFGFVRKEDKCHVLMSERVSE